MSEASTIQLTAHPRARRHIAKAKGWGGLLGFNLVLFMSLRAHSDPFDAGLHALLGGVGLYLLGWAAAVTIWREVAVAEVEMLRRRVEAEHLAAAEAAEAEAEARARRSS